MVDLIISSAAESEFTKSLCWYAERSLTAAEQFEFEFDRVLETIAEDPARLPLCDDRHRYYLMRRFPFRVIIREHTDHWVVIAVAHTSRDPDYWTDR